jgi:hypothetical protein
MAGAIVTMNIASRLTGFSFAGNRRSRAEMPRAAKSNAGRSGNE